MPEHQRQLRPRSPELEEQLQASNEVPEDVVPEQPQAQQREVVVWEQPQASARRHEDDAQQHHHEHDVPEQQEHQRSRSEQLEQLRPPLLDLVEAAQAFEQQLEDVVRQLRDDDAREHPRVRLLALAELPQVSEQQHEGDVPVGLVQQHKDDARQQQASAQRREDVSQRRHEEQPQLRSAALAQWVPALLQQLVDDEPVQALEQDPNLEEQQHDSDSVRTSWRIESTIRRPRTYRNGPASQEDTRNRQGTSGKVAFSPNWRFPPLYLTHRQCTHQAARNRTKYLSTLPMKTYIILI
ncbi:unnamed protein product [Trichogramma brassicae]|uniref:Uncharacterized protein n=1 Tax=Trichogramma brassicae TaxID=86971 RepID=A0A6H5IZ15_9HYME|nr:unnamed protein product [Trichogramma brassicae]